jgi:hypothetical protein
MGWHPGDRLCSYSKHLIELEKMSEELELALVLALELELAPELVLVLALAFGLVLALELAQELVLVFGLVLDPETVYFELLQSCPSLQKSFGKLALCFDLSTDLCHQRKL